MPLRPPVLRCGALRPYIGNSTVIASDPIRNLILVFPLSVRIVQLMLFALSGSIRHGIGSVCFPWWIIGSRERHRHVEMRQLYDNLTTTFV
jgi:hypothetical protein